MHDEKRSKLTSRRTALRALGAGALTATAGCLFGGDDGGENDSTENVSDTATNTEATTRETREPTTGTATHEQSIISGTPATATRTTSTAGTTSTAEPSTIPTTGTPNRTETAETTAATGTTTAAETTTTTAVTETPAPETTGTQRTTSTPTSTTERTNTPRSTDGWTEQAPLPVVGSDAGGGVLDGKLYFFGGIETATGLAAVARTFAYDPAAGSGGAWERLPDLPRALWGPCGVATDDALYSFGGAPDNSPYADGSPSDAIFRYRPGDGWTNLTETRGVRCPYPNWVMGGVYNPGDGLIYCVGGGTGAHETASATDHGFDRDAPGTFDERRLWTFDPRTERVADGDLARMPEAKRWPTVALFDLDGTRYLHAIGGLLGTTGPTDSNFRYDLGTGRWERAQPMPRPGTYATHSNPVIDNRAYLSHGMFWEGEPTVERYETVTHRYDPAADDFETDLPEPTHRRGGATSGVIDGTLYVVGGHIKRFEQNGLHDCVAYNEAYSPARD